MKISKFIYLPAVIAFLAMLASCSGTQDFSSKWADQPVTIDGSGEEWKHKTTYFKDGDILLGVQNDGKYLYIALTTSDRQTKMQILMQGLEIWFDKKGGTDKLFGIKFPIGARESGYANLHKEGRENNDKHGEHNNNDEWIESLIEHVTNSTTIKLMEQDDYSQKMELQDAPGIEAKISRSNDVLIYEMKIALMRDTANKYSLELSKNARTLGFGIETEEMQFKKPEGTENRGRGEFPGQNGHSHGRGNFNPGAEMPAPLKMWFSLSLAKK